MKTILFPTDFSNNALHASQYAGMLARRYDAKVILLNIYEMTVPVVSEFQMTYDTDNMIVQRGKDAEQNLQFFTDKFIINTNLPPEQISQMVEYGLVSDVIIDISKKMNVDLIVMGTKGASNTIDRWLGTNAENVMEAAQCPVWIVPENTLLTLPQTIMYAADFKEDEVTATYKVLSMAQPLGATCKVIHIHDYFELNVEQTVEQTVAELKDEFQNFDISFKNLNREEIVKGLETYIEKHKPDVLALAVYEKSFFSKLFNSHITQHFIQEAKLPMLFFKK
ncbi:universal stress protein [Emticicia sp. SJ17W-69]|uniref:universal stress protein n=1 Tax=Emticicia sp. SJ17W-69 TaxID=3421657 RepID=UPI003EBE507A